MTRIAIAGLKADATSARIVAEVKYFADKAGKVKIVILSATSIQLMTAKGSYVLEKHPTQNYYNATCNGRKVQVSLKAISGEIRFW